MAKIDLEQIAALADLAETLPAVKQEIADIEKSIGRLNALLANRAAGKRSGRPKGKPGPKPKGKPGPKPKPKGKASPKPKGKVGPKPVETPAPKPKAKKAVKKAATKKTPQKKRAGMKEKVIAAIANGTLTAAELKAVDGRANAKFLKNMVKDGVLKVADGKYSKA